MAEEEGGKAFVWESAFVWVFIGAGTASTIWATHSLNLIITNGRKEGFKSRCKDEEEL